MIDVIRHDDGVEIKGHADYAEHGKDIVCAGISALVQTLVQSVLELTDDKIKYVMQPGTVDIYFGNLSEGGKLLFDSFFVGIEMISGTHPDHVRIVQACTT